MGVLVKVLKIKIYTAFLMSIFCSQISANAVEYCEKYEFELQTKEDLSYWKLSYEGAYVKGVTQFDDATNTLIVYAHGAFNKLEHLKKMELNNSMSCVFSKVLPMHDGKIKALVTDIYPFKIVCKVLHAYRSNQPKNPNRFKYYGVGDYTRFLSNLVEVGAYSHWEKILLPFKYKILDISSDSIEKVGGGTLSYLINKYDGFEEMIKLECDLSDKELELIKSDYGNFYMPIEVKYVKLLLAKES